MLRDKSTKKFCFNNAKSLAPSLHPFRSFVSRADLIRVPFLMLSILACSPAPRRKIYLQEKSMRVHFSNSDRTDTKPGISFPGRGCLTFLVTFVLNRRRDPDILSASSLTCRYRYIGSAPAEKPSLFFILALRARIGCIYFHVAAISLV